jgi:hypothetical protein
VKLAQLKKQLLRDLQRSPKKAAVLGLSCLLALYFWAPLVTGYFNPTKPKRVAKETATAAESASPAGPAAGGWGRASHAGGSRGLLERTGRSDQERPTDAERRHRLDGYCGLRRRFAGGISGGKAT